ncbi:MULTISPECIES: amidohydrolase family protein [unclassified Beijerinckia]|uniref:amidohydrolase family protein n=1 Tax=unclassified Beijerinckia TaxID=2638183 RepID=UPI00089AC15E|nr:MULTISPECIES: amidohydrolase family protein [unclassified Beijerinckia]MDH7798819.1 cytosine deaminase [Beijerinckia sp. GAS462]SED89825.1 Cytosine/adenosine deaminase [Beijerinckia sp. 28-YEA-48]
MTRTIIVNARPWGGEPVDLEIVDSVIAGITPHRQTAGRDGDTVDGRGRLILPAFTDIHTHLDSSRLGLPFRPHTGAPDVWGMVMNDRANWRSADGTAASRAIHTLGLMIARGTTRVRSYAQIDVDCGLERFEAVLAAREAHSARSDVKVIAFPQTGFSREQGVLPLLEEALRSGADVMGGIDPCQLERDPVRHLDTVFGLAQKYQVPVDFHLHEPGDLAVFSVELILERVRALGMRGMVSISHAYSLGGVSESTTRRLIEQFAELDIAMATVAPSVSTALPLRSLVESGVRIGLGEDGMRDYWKPYGNADMLDRTWQLAFTNNFLHDQDIEMCLGIGTIGGGSMIAPAEVPRLVRGGCQGVAVGDTADLILLDGQTPTSAVMDRSSDRTVLRKGRVVADQLQLV